MTKIRTAYTNQLHELDDRMAAFGTMAAKDVLLCGTALCEGNASLARDILGGRPSAERDRRSIEDLCMNLLLLQQPLGRDIRLVTATFRAVPDLARIDEMSRDVCETAIDTPGVAESAAAPVLKELSQVVEAMVQRAVDAFVTRDAALAQEVEPMDDEVDALFSRAVTTVVDGLREGGESAYDAPGVLMAAKYFERMGDHAVIVADWAAFRAEGVIEQASGVCHGV